MRSYMHHLGDWSSHTDGLSLIEYAIYHKLVAVYYVNERALPGSIELLIRAVHAYTRLERLAVHSVVAQFFTLEADGLFHQKRCDEELVRHAQFVNSQKAKIAKRWEGHNGKKALAESQLLMDSARRQLLPKQAPSLQARQLLQETEQLTLTPRSPAQLGTESSDTNGNTDGIPAELPGLYRPIAYKNKEKTQTPVIGETGETARRAAGVCLEKGFKVDPGNPRLLALVADGATPAHFAEAAGIAAAAGKPFAFLAGIVANQLSDALRMPREATQTGSGSPNYPMLPRWHDPH
jgi:uncharacterized protein YdaU (DUF1376 family)